MTRILPKIVQQLRQEEQQGSLDGATPASVTNTQENSLFNALDQVGERDVLKTLIQIAEKSNTGILITDNNGFIQYINDQYGKISGYSLEDLKGKDIRKLQSTNQPKSFYQQLVNIIRSGNIWTGEIESTRKNKEIYWQRTTIIPIIDYHGSISYFMTLNEEITQKRNIEQNLRIKENAILSSINAILLTDLSGRITYVNPSFLRMWAFDTEKKVLGKSVFSLWKKGGEYVKIMDQIVSTGGWLGELTAKSNQGRLFPVQMSASIVRDEQNHPLSIMASFVDITKQKRMEKNYKKFKKISDEADYGSIIFDLQGTIIYGNESFAQMHGYTSNEITGKSLKILFEKNQNESVQNLLSELKENGKIIGEEQWHITKDGHKFPLLVTSTIIDDKQFHQPFVAGTMIDISKIKDAEQQIISKVEEVNMMNKELNVAREQLAILNQNLEIKVKERTAEINKLLKQKDNFINQLGHDLKTPLTPMFALLPLLEKKINDEKGKEYISLIERNSHFMRDLVNKTIMYAKLNSDNIEFSFSKINIHDFVEMIKEDFNQLFEDNQTDLQNDTPSDIIVQADTIQLKEVFNNLISNAIKYKQDQKPLHISVNAKQSEHQTLISIKDNGIGMTAEQISNVFDEFYKADDSRSDIDSHGLGLNICKRIIEKHNGSIWVESEGIGNGSTFTFTLNRKMNPVDDGLKEC